MTHAIYASCNEPITLSNKRRLRRGPSSVVVACGPTKLCLCVELLRTRSLNSEVRSPYGFRPYSSLDRTLFWRCGGGACTLHAHLEPIVLYTTVRARCGTVRTVIPPTRPPQTSPNPSPQMPKAMSRTIGGAVVLHAVASGASGAALASLC